VVCWREHRVIVVFVWLPAARMEGGTVVVHTHSLTFREEQKEPGFPEPPVPRFDTEPVLSPLSRVFENSMVVVSFSLTQPNLLGIKVSLCCVSKYCRY